MAQNDSNERLSRMNSLQAALEHPQINCLDYWTNLPTHVERMIGPGDADRGFLVTHESEHLELCLVTFARRAFVRDTRNGATLYTTVQPSLCLAVETYISRRKEPFSV